VSSESPVFDPSKLAGLAFCTEQRWYLFRVDGREYRFDCPLDPEAVSGYAVVDAETGALVGIRHPSGVILAGTEPELFRVYLLRPLLNASY